MSVIARIRAYHAVLVALAVLAYATGELGLVHAWLGYGVAAVILFRLAWSLTGARQLGLMKFYPQFEGLKLGNAFTHPAISRVLLLGIALSLIGVTGTGVLIDRGKAVGLTQLSAIAPAYADEEDGPGEAGEAEESPLGELHEALANILVVLVGLHVTYLILFKWPLVRFMLFLDKAGGRRGNHGPSS
jgi:cytochrome b